MEAENRPFENKKHLPNPSCLGSMLILRGAMRPAMILKLLNKRLIS